MSHIEEEAYDETEEISPVEARHADATIDPRRREVMMRRGLTALVVCLLFGALLMSLLLRIRSVDALLTITWTVVLVLYLAFCFGYTIMTSHHIPRLTKRKLKKTAEPPHIPPSLVTLKYSSLRRDQLEETLYDSQRSWAFTVLMMTNPWVVREIDIDVPLWPRVKRGLIVHGVVFLLAVIASVFTFARGAPNVTVTVIIGFLACYITWGIYIIITARRRRWIIAKQMLERFSNQVLFTPNSSQSILAEEFTQHKVMQETIVGKLLGYVHVSVNTTEAEEEFAPLIRFVRDYNRVKISLDWIRERRHAPLEQYDGSQQRKEADVPTPLPPQRTVIIHRRSDRRRP